MLPSQNREWGFYGTIRHRMPPDDAWPIAMQMIQDTAGCTPAAARRWLDSSLGRHFADSVIDEMIDDRTIHEAIQATIPKWDKYLSRPVRRRKRAEHQDKVPALCAQIARLWAELHEADPALALDLAKKLPTMEIKRG